MRIGGWAFPVPGPRLAFSQLALAAVDWTLAGAVFVDRGNNARAARSLTAAGEIMKERHSSLWLFPEGTRSMRPHSDMLPFKKGAFHLAVQAGVPIVPVVVANYSHILYLQDFTFRSGTVPVKVTRSATPTVSASVFKRSP